MLRMELGGPPVAVSILIESVLSAEEGGPFLASGTCYLAHTVVGDRRVGMSAGNQDAEVEEWAALTHMLGEEQD